MEPGVLTDCEGARNERFRSSQSCHRRYVVQFVDEWDLRLISDTGHEVHPELSFGDDADVGCLKAVS